MRLLLLIAVAILLAGCCGSTPMTMKWQPIPAFVQEQTVPQQMVAVPLQPAYTVQAAPTYVMPPSAPRAAPCP